MNGIFEDPYSDGILEYNLFKKGEIKMNMDEWAEKEVEIA